jgi:hypothetical protein
VGEPFDIREWARQRNVSLPADNADVRDEVVSLFRRGLTPERIAAYVEQLQSRQGRTSRRSADDAERTYSGSA